MGAPAESQWVWIERDHGAPDAVVGPYPTEAAAVRALNESLLVQGLVEENCLECYVSYEAPDLDDDDVFLIELDDAGNELDIEVEPSS